jgi:hypothetical protein
MYVALKVRELKLHCCSKNICFFNSAYYTHRWVRLLKQQSSITEYCSPIKENKLPIFGCCLQQTNGSLPFPLSVCSKQTEIYMFVYMERGTCGDGNFHLFAANGDIYIYMLPFQTENGSAGDFP